MSKRHYAAAAAALLVSTSANATLFLGAWSQGAVYSVDLDTQATSLVASGFGRISGMEGIGNDLYVFDQNNERVTQLDPSDGSVIGVDTISSNVVSGEGTFAMRPDKTGFTSNSSGTTGTYFTFDLGAGTTTQIGTGISFDGVDFAPNGVLYGLSQASSTSGGSQLHIIDPTTGSTTLIGSTGITSGSLAGLVVAEGDFIAGIGSNLYRIDPFTASATFLFNPGIGDISGAAFLGSTNPGTTPNPGPVPEPASLALLGAGLAFMRRRRQG